MRTKVKIEERSGGVEVNLI